MTSTKPPPRQRTLRQRLKDLVNLLPGRSNKPTTVGSGILRKADSFAPSLPRFSTVSLFPDFEAPQSTGPTHLASIHTVTPRPSVRTVAVLPQISIEALTKSLLPATSLSQFGLREAYLRQNTLPQRVAYETVSNAYLSGASKQASLATLTESSLRQSASTLRLAASTSTSLTSLSTFSQDTIRTSKPSASSPATSPGSPTVHHPLRKQSSQRTLSSLSPQRSGSREKQRQDPLTSINHFKSFCVLDTAISGCPVTATSAELKFVFDIGEQFFLNNQECQEASMDIITGFDAAGDEITHLVLFSPLVSPSSGRSRYLLASLIDVTEFMTETATLPPLDVVSEEGLPGGFGLTHDTPALDNPRRTNNHELSTEDLLGGCYISESSSRARGLRRESSEDIWLALAATERKISPSPRRARDKSRDTRAPLTSESFKRSTSSSVDDVLEQFIASLQLIYSDFFLLGQSPLDDSIYEICNVSPKVYAGNEYVQGHLSRTPHDVLNDLSAHLSKDSAFSMPVRWGTRGEPKHLYCSPLYGQNSLTWICYLVDGAIPTLW